MYTLKLTLQQLKAMLILTGGCAGVNGSYGVYDQLADMDERLAASLLDENFEHAQWMGLPTVILPNDL